MQAKEENDMWRFVPFDFLNYQQVDPNLLWDASRTPGTSSIMFPLGRTGVLFIDAALWSGGWGWFAQAFHAYQTSKAIFGPNQQ